MNKEITESIFFRHNPDPMWVFDVESLRFLDVNNAALQSYGYSLDEFLAMGIGSIRPPEDMPALKNFLDHGFEPGKSSIWRHVLKNGDIIHVSVNGYPIPYQNRAAMIVSARDVTQLVELQRENSALLERERQVRQEAENAARYFQSLFETIPGKFLVLAPPDFEIVAVSDAYLEATMRKREEIKGLNLFEVFPSPPDDSNADGVRNLRASLVHACITGVADVMPVQHYPIPRPQALGGGFEDRYWSAVNTPIKGPDQQVAYIVHRTEDVTALVTQSGQSETVLPTAALDHTRLLELDVILHARELKAAQQRSEDLSSQLRIALESMSDAFFTLDADWRFTFLNAQAEHVLARNRSELLGKVVWEEFPAAVNSRFESEYRRAFDQQTTVRFVEFYPPPLEKWFEVNAYPSRDSLAVYFRDITESRLRDEKLRQAQKMEVVGQLTGGIAHDFNNLLTVILGNTELLAMQLQNQPNLYKLAEIAAAAANKGAELTSRLLAFSRRQTLSPKLVDINSLIENMTPLLQRALSENIAMIPRRSNDAWPVEVDPAQLESAILNIAINARDAMPYGGEFMITTRNHKQSPGSTHATVNIPAGDYVVIECSDTGCGMAADLLDKVFEPFFTTKETGKGSGLGLSMVLGFVQQSHGYLDIHSSPGKGTTLSMYFPKAQRPTALYESPVTLSEPATGGSEHILLVEDNELVKEYIAGQLIALGYRVSVADSGPQALKSLEMLDDIDLLLTDIIMPHGMSGTDLAIIVRELRPEIRVLFSSGFTDGLLEDEFNLPEGVEFLAKPFTRKDLARKVRAALDKVAH